MKKKEDKLKFKKLGEIQGHTIERMTQKEEEPLVKQYKTQQRQSENRRATS